MQAEPGANLSARAEQLLPMSTRLVSHTVRMAAVILALAAVMLLPFLPGGYDGLAQATGYPTGDTSGLTEANRDEQ